MTSQRSELATRPLVIADTEALRAFSRSHDFASSRPVVLELPNMSPAESFAISERLNRDRSECGCSLGATALAAGSALSVGLLLVRYGLLTVAFVERLPIALAAGFACAAIGKAVGVGLGRWRARRDVSRIYDLFNDGS
jgi:hypothetical protein